jgi:hypothetical protein
MYFFGFWAFLAYTWFFPEVLDYYFCKLSNESENTQFNRSIVAADVKLIALSKRFGKRLACTHVLLGENINGISMEVRDGVLRNVVR